MVSGSKFTLLGIAIILFSIAWIMLCKMGFFHGFFYEFFNGIPGQLSLIAFPITGLVFSILGCFFMYEEYDD